MSAMTCDDVLGEGGKLKNIFASFVPRQSQLEMARAISQAIDDENKLIVEAGTGIGKTFAYLVPALLSNKKVLVSTGTKNLQDQLYYKDLPLIRKLFPVTKKVVLLKGRANYLCWYRLENAAQEASYESRSLVTDLALINKWSLSTKSGEISELVKVPESSKIWPYVTSSADNCVGSECPFFDKCFVSKIRKEALLADVVVVNHHLFFADLALKEEGFGQLLPGSDVVILDEAHHLAEIATQFFSERISSRQLFNLISDVLAEYQTLGQDFDELPELLDELKVTVADVRQHLGEVGRKEDWTKVRNNQKLLKALDTLQEQVSSLTELLALQSDRSKGMESVYERSLQVKNALYKLLNAKADHDYVHWFETFAQTFSINITPLSVADNMKDFYEQKKMSWVFTSATLGASDGFDYFKHPLGLDDEKCLQLPSPFPYKKNTLYYLPRMLPDVSERNYIEAFVDSALPILEANKGRAFMLFTSYFAMNLAQDLLKNSGFELLVQGNASKHRLIEKFKSRDNAVLLGTNSFWQGVDVQGAKLSCVFIDKLPFASPGDPVMQAKISAMKRQGKSPFNDYQLPSAIIALKQGVGRLIRDDKDFGVLVIGDLRLLAKNYAEQFWNALPGAKLIRDEDKVINFLQEKHDEVLSD